MGLRLESMNQIGRAVSAGSQFVAEPVFGPIHPLRLAVLTLRRDERTWPFRG